MIYLMRNKILGIVICLSFILPLSLSVGIIPFDYRFILLAIPMFVILDIIYDKWSLRKLGLSIYNIKKGVGIHIFLISISILFVLILSEFLGQQRTNIWLSFYHFNPLYLFALSFVQELVYRFYLIEKLGSLFKNKYIVIWMSSFLFGFLHIFLEPTFLMFSLTFFVWLLWGVLYDRYKNLILLSVFHMLLNFFIVFNCYISSFPGCSV